jgi:hypothetical protein
MQLPHFLLALTIAACAAVAQTPDADLPQHKRIYPGCTYRDEFNYDDISVYTVDGTTLTIEECVARCVASPPCVGFTYRDQPGSLKKDSCHMKASLSKKASKSTGLATISTWDCPRSASGPGFDLMNTCEVVRNGEPSSQREIWLHHLAWLAT